MLSYRVMNKRNERNKAEQIYNWVMNKRNESNEAEQIYTWIMINEQAIQRNQA
jgi:hypothetical protein